MNATPLADWKSAARGVAYDSHTVSVVIPPSFGSALFVDERLRWCGVGCASVARPHPRYCAIAERGWCLVPWAVYWQHMSQPSPRPDTVTDATPVPADDPPIMLSDGVFALALTLLALDLRLPEDTEPSAAPRSTCGLGISPLASAFSCCSPSGAPTIAAAARPPTGPRPPALPQRAQPAGAGSERRLPVGGGVGQPAGAVPLAASAGCGSGGDAARSTIGGRCTTHNRM